MASFANRGWKNLFFEKYARVVPPAELNYPPVNRLNPSGTGLLPEGNPSQDSKPMSLRIFEHLAAKDAS